MKVLEESIGELSNNEVLQVLQQRGAHRQGSQRKALPSECQVYTYLLENQGGVRERERLQAFTAAVKQFGLSRVEALQLLDQRPTRLVELHLMIPDCEARLEPAQMQELLALVAQHLGN